MTVEEIKKLRTYYENQEIIIPDIERQRMLLIIDSVLELRQISDSLNRKPKELRKA